MNQQSLHYLDIKNWNLRAKRFCYKRGIDDQTAEDLIQNTWTVFLKDQNHFQKRSSLSTFLFGILRFKILEHRRGAKKNHDLCHRVLESVNSEYSEEQDKLNQERLIWRMQSRQQLLTAFDSLPLKQKAVLASRHDDVFGSMGPLKINKNNECVLYHRSKKAMQKALSEYSLVAD